MHRKKSLAIIGLLITIACPALAQAPDWDAYNKYWYYRYRLVNEFLIRGEGGNCNEPSAYSIPAEGAFMYGGDLHWSDGSMYLGWYISVLATEYKLLTLNNQPTEKTRQELYYAMKAYERLDRRAERLFYPQNANANCSDQYLNGLFVRDDVTEAAFQNYPAFRARYETDQQFAITSDYNGSNHGVDNINAYPSQDQIAHLFMGFALVKQCLGSASYNGYNFTQQAILYTDKIASHLDENDWFGRLENGEIYDNGKTFRDEATAYGIAKAAQWITGVDYTSKLSATGQIPWVVSQWQKYGDPTYGPSIMSYLIEVNKVDFTSALLQSLAAVGSSWEFGLIPTKREFTINLPGICYRQILGSPFFYPCAARSVTIACYEYQLSNPGFIVNIPMLGCQFYLPTITIPVTREALSSYGMLYNQQIFALLHEYLHGATTPILSSIYSSQINNAPCDGPHHSTSAAGVNGWRGSNRWVRPLMADGYNNYEKRDTDGEFNGLDYMLLYNLYLLTRDPNNITFKNMLNTVSANTISTAGKYWSYETLELSGVVKNTASTSSNPVELTTNQRITLKPGFKIERGAIAKIYTGNYTACNTSKGMSSNLRVASSEVADNALNKEALFADLATKLQSKLDSVAETLSTSSSYTPLTEYLSKRNAEVKNDNSDVDTESRFNEENVSLFPNPSDDHFYLQLDLKKGKDVIILMTSIYNSSTIKLFEGYLKSGANKLKFNCADLPKGIYTVEIKGKNLLMVKRMIK